MEMPSGTHDLLHAEIEKLQKKVAELEKQLDYFQHGDSDAFRADGFEKSQRRLFEILEITSDLVSTATVDGKLTYLNSAGRILVGWGIEERLDGKLIADLHPGWTLERIETEGLVKAMANGSWEGETAVLHRDGRQIPVSQVILAHRSPDGTLQYFSTIMRNITGRKQLENAVRESEEKFRHLFAVSPEALLFADTSTFEVLEANDAAVDLYGYTREELLKLRPIDLSAQPGATAQALKTGEKKIPLRLHRRKDGTVFPVELTTSTFDWQGRRVQFGSVRDISERLMAEEKLLEQARELSAINTLGQAVNATLDFDTITNTALQEVMNSVHPDLAFFFVRDEDRLILKSILPEGSRQRIGDVPQHRIGECICGLAARDKKAMFSRDVYNDLRCSWEECKRAGIKSFAALPLCSEDEVIGVVGLASDVERDFETHSGFLQTLAGQISSALINARLYQTAQQEIAQRKQAEDELYLKSLQLDVFMENAPYSIQHFDLEGHTISVNKAFYNIYPTFPPPQWSIFHDEQLERAGLGPLFERLRQGETVEIPQLWFKPDRSVPGVPGRDRCNSIVIFPLLDASGQIQKYASIAQDITERIQTEQQREQALAMLQAAIAQSPSGILVADAPDVTIRWANPAALGIRGATDVPLTGIEVSQHTANWQVFHPDGTPYPPEDLPLSRAILKGQTTRDEEAVIRNAQGEDRYIIVNAAPIRDREGEIISGIVIFHDITERKEAAETQRKSENLISSIFRAAPTGIGVVSNRVLITVNDRICEMTGYSRDRLVGKSARVLYPSDEDYEYVGREKYLQIQERGTGTVETRWLHSDGQIIDVLMSSTPINPSDLTAGVTFTALDITEMKHIRDELKELNASLELKVAERTAQLVAANKELEAFSYSVSHDLRAPLRSISGFTNILLEDYGTHLDDEGKRTCSLISGNAKKMGQLIDDLLAFSRLARKETNITRIGMKSLACTSFNELTTASENERIKLTIGELEDCNGDKDMMRQVWINLLSNAIKFSAKIDHPEIIVASSRDGQKVFYHIKDNGAGFENSYKDKLFGVFQRLHNGSEFEGTGVGLAIVQRIVLRHGGEVGAESEVGKGATFWFSIPDSQGINQ